jgi:hypothetical protein
VANTSGSTLEQLSYLAGASADQDGEKLFATGQVRLQAYDPHTRTWDDVDEYGYAAGWVGYTDKLKPGYQVDIPMRMNVAASAPVGAGFTLGATPTARASATARPPTASRSWPPVRTRTAPSRSKAAGRR